MTKEKQQMIKSWTEQNVLLFPIIKITKEQLVEESRTQYDVIASIGYVCKEGVVEAPAYMVHSGHSIGQVVKLKDPFTVGPNDIQNLLQEINRKKYHICGDLTSWLITKSYEDGQEYYYYAFRIPCKENTEI